MNRGLFLKTSHQCNNSAGVDSNHPFRTTATMSLYGIFLENNVKILAMISILPKGHCNSGRLNVNDLFSNPRILFCPTM
ncbi:MAG: hypothetical protein R2758_09890 [Bacteroidales bacterium]